MNYEILVVVNWHNFLILLIKNNNSIKIKPWFQFEVFFFGEDENNWLLKLWFLKTSEAQKYVEVSRIKKILARNWPIGICLYSVRNFSWLFPTMSTQVPILKVFNHVFFPIPIAFHIHSQFKIYSKMSHTQLV